VAPDGSLRSVWTYPRFMSFYVQLWAIYIFYQLGFIGSEAEGRLISVCCINFLKEALVTQSFKVASDRKATIKR
jgi:hypothetical protein